MSWAGELDRRRLLDASLSALTRPVHANNAGWFCKFHETLEPSQDERVRLQPTYMDLLASPIPFVVGFAIAAVKVLAESGRLDVDHLVASIAPAFDLRQKGHAIAAVQLLRVAAERNPAMASQLGVVAARGLSHVAPDVQKACVELIESLFTSADANLANALANQLNSVAASLRSRVDAILGKTRRD